jgi:tRNA-dihydrouridine synthase
MSFIKTAIAAGAVSLAMLSGAAAQNPEPWTLAERNAYILMMDGRTMTVRLNDQAMARLMKSAKRVPRGTVLIMSNGQLYQVNAAKMMFDREGNWMAMGGGG